jgi:hypothetical protein
LDISSFVFNFAANIINKINMDNEVVDEKYCVDLRDYYKKLDKPEKGMLLSYLTGEIGFGYSTLVNKFAGRLRFSRVDIWVIRKVINEKLWRR